MTQTIIIDSDTGNEIDDQYAITYAVRSGKFHIRGFTAVHFGKQGSMEKSHRELCHVLELLNTESPYQVFKGADKAMTDTHTPVDSPAAQFIISEAMKSSGDPLHVLCIGAITNPASAFLIEPGIQDRIRVLWLAGQAWPRGGLFFNNRNDMQAAQAVFASGLDLTLMPARGTADRIRISLRDRKQLKGKGRIGDYLWKLYMRRPGIPKSIYDVAAVAALARPEYCISKTVPRPALRANGTYDHSATNGVLNVITEIDADLIRKDFFACLENSAIAP